MKRHANRIVWLLAAGCLAAGGCSVKEDRQPCPCYLDVDYRELLAADLFPGEPGVVDVALFLPELTFHSTHALGSCPEMEEQTVSRNTVRLVAVVGTRLPEGFPERGTQIRYDEGNQMDSLYVHAGDVDCSAEDALCVLRPKKQFSTLTLTDGQDGALLRRYNLVVRGTTCGLDAADLSAIEGPYLYTLQEYDRLGNISVRIPRQKERTLMLDFYDKESYIRLFSTPLGLYLFDAGYDPDAPELSDYTFQINFERALVYLRIADWEKEYVYQLYQ